ncbi:MAG: hypothetical protein RIS92_2731 [Verrucomicrobiota bacterium]
MLEVRGVFDSGGGDANDFATCVHQIDGLLDAGRRVHGVAGQHGLDAHGVVSANGNVTGADGACGAAKAWEEAQRRLRGLGHFDGAGWV